MILLFLEVTCHVFSTGNFRKELAIRRGLREPQFLAKGKQPPPAWESSPERSSRPWLLGSGQCEPAFSLQGLPWMAGRGNACSPPWVFIHSNLSLPPIT